jgi:isopenicillin-N N-acyltransferase-like protein
VTLAVAHASGGPRSLGRAQGEAFAEPIAGALGFYRELADRKQMDVGAMVDSAHACLDVARGQVPDLVAELEGLAEGAGVALDEVALLNCLEEVWDFDACTTMIHGPWLMHAEQWYAGHSHVGVVVAQPDDGPGFVSPTCAGFLGAVGMNASGFAQGIDSLGATDDRTGIPRVLVSRLALGARGLDGAIRAACIPGRAGGYAHTLVTSDRRVVVETTALEQRLVESPSAHTNHHLAPDPPPTASRGSRGSRARLERAAALLAEAPPKSFADCARLLADHDSSPQSICEHEEGFDGSGTVFGMVCDLASGRMLVSDGPPCSNRWEELEVPGFTSAEVARVG